MNRKIIFLLLALCILTFALACSNADSGEGKDSETVGIAETTSPDTTADTTAAETTKSLTVVAGTAPKPETEEITTTVALTTELTTKPIVTQSPVTKAPETTTAKTEPETTRAPETIVLHRHDYSVKEQVEPTCSNEGKVILYCECGDSTSNYVEKLPHQLGQATCISGPACKVCGEIEGSPLFHDIKDGVCSLCNNRVYRIGMSGNDR